MAALTPDVQQLIVLTCGISVVPLIAIPLAMLLMRQLRMFGLNEQDD
jgi:hypothetical protein